MIFHNKVYVFLVLLCRIFILNGACLFVGILPRFFFFFWETFSLLEWCVLSFSYGEFLFSVADVSLGFSNTDYYSRFSRDVTAAMLVYRAIAKKVFLGI